MTSTLSPAPSEPRDERPRALTLADVADELGAKARRYEALRAAGKPLGPRVPTDFPKLAEALDYFLEPGVHTIQGGAGLGKSAFAIQLAADSGTPVVYVTAEMAATEILQRLLARHHTRPHTLFRARRIDPDDLDGFARDTIAAYPFFALLDGTRQPITVRDVGETALALRERAGADHVVIVIDSLHAWAAGAYSDVDEYVALGRAMAHLNGLALDLECPVLAIVEKTLASMRDDSPFGAAGSRKLLFTPLTAIDLQRDANAAQDVYGETPVTLKFTKNRHGRISPIDYRFNGAYMRFREAP